MTGSRNDQQRGTASHEDGDRTPLEEVAETARLLDDLERRQRQAVVRALDDHSWSEIGAALGVSKQAAHRKFVKSLAGELQAQVAGVKGASRSGRADEVVSQAAALASTAALMRKRRRD